MTKQPFQRRLQARYALGEPRNDLCTKASVSLDYNTYQAEAKMKDPSE
jgi:hypothetical protein